MAHLVFLPYTDSQGIGVFTCTMGYIGLLDGGFPHNNNVLAYIAKTLILPLYNLLHCSFFASCYYSHIMDRSSYKARLNV
jgi:hypothetical protein